MQQLVVRILLDERTLNSIYFAEKVGVAAAYLLVVDIVKRI